MWFKVTQLLFLVLGLTSAKRIPFLTKQKDYTPLLFFKVPKDIIPACDEMEKVVSEVEKELGVRVERLDIARDSVAESALSVLTKRSPPFLYNRESCQVVYVPGASAGGDDQERDSKIDKERVRAWAKGRFLPSVHQSSNAPVVLSKEDSAIDQADLLEDMDLSPIQKSGKEAIKKRTEEKAKEAAQ